MKTSVSAQASLFADKMVSKKSASHPITFQHGQRNGKFRERDEHLPNNIGFAIRTSLSLIQRKPTKYFQKTFILLNSIPFANE